VLLSKTEFIVSKFTIDYLRKHIFICTLTQKLNFVNRKLNTVLDCLHKKYQAWLWRSRKEFIARIPVYSQLTERVHLRSTPLQQLRT